MLKLIIEKEIRDLIGSTKFAITFGACAFLIIIAFYVGVTRHNLNRSQFEASTSENLRSMEGMTDWNELEGTRIFLPPQLLAALVSGVSNDIGRTASIRGRGEVITSDSRYNEDPIFAIFRFIDLEFIFKVILSLFAILLGYDTVSGEKERGTLRLSFANALPRQTYIIGKLLGSFLALTVSIVAAIAVGTLWMPLLNVSLSSAEWLKLLFIIFAGLLYFGSFLTLSIFVSALTQRTANSFLILLVIWVLCIQIIPRTSVLLAARSVDVPSVDEIAYKKSGLNSQLRDEFSDGMSEFSVGSGTTTEDLVSKFNLFMDSLNDVRDQKLLNFSSRLNEERQNRQRVQESLAFILARSSPATSFSLAASYLAGTSLRLKNQFLDEAKTYQASFADFMTEKTGMNSGGFVKIRKSTSCGGKGEEEQTELPETIDINEIPGFTYHSPKTSEALKAATVDIGLLFMFNLIFFAGAVVAFGKYDVR